MILNGLHPQNVHSGQSLDSRISKPYSKSAIGIASNMSLALMSAGVTGICILCGFIALILSVCIGGGCAYFKVNRKKMVTSLEESDIHCV